MENPSKFGDILGLFWSCFSLKLHFPLGLKYNKVARRIQFEKLRRLFPHTLLIIINIKYIG